MSKIISNRVAFWDGDNFVIVTKNCTREQAAKMMSVLAACDLGIEEQAPDSYAEPADEMEETLPVIPDDVAEAIASVAQVEAEEAPEEAVQEEEMLFPSGKYAGMSPSEVLKRHGGKGFANLSFIRSRLPQGHPMVDAIKRAQLAYFREHGREAYLQEELNRPGKLGPQDNPIAYQAVERIDRLPAGQHPDGDWRKFFAYYGGILDAEDRDQVLQKTGEVDFQAFLAEAPIETLKSLAAAVLEKYAVCDR